MIDVPNLDGMNRDELLALRKSMRAIAALAKNVANYCEAKANAIQMRESGKIETALRFERACDAIYERLPKEAQW